MKSIIDIVKRIISFFAYKAIRTYANVILDEVERLRQQKLLIETQRILSQIQCCGANVRINGSIFISDPKSVVVGNNVHIGANAYFSTAGGLTIGHNTHISRNVTIYTVNHNYLGNSLPYDDTEIPKPVCIGRNVWIGMNVTIVPGVHIGDGVIVGMGTVVTHDVPPLAIVGSQPTRIMKYRDANHYMQLEKYLRYGGINGKPLSEDEIKDFGLGRKNPGGQIFFVVTTGRSGSMTIAHVLSRHSQITCLHEPRPQLIRLSTEFAHGLKDYERTKKELYAIYCNGSTFPADIYGESDQKIWNLISIMAELLPTSKFIWLIRDGRNVVASTVARGWFTSEEAKKGHPTSHKLGPRWIYYRLDGAKCGFFSEKEWKQLPVFERNCWYWFYVNSKIEKQLNELHDNSRWIVLRLEELEYKISKLLMFLCAEAEPVQVARLNVASYPTMGWEHWNRREKGAFEQWCGEAMNRWYPGWKNRDGISQPWQVSEIQTSKFPGLGKK